MNNSRLAYEYDNDEALHVDGAMNSKMMTNQYIINGMANQSGVTIERSPMNRDSPNAKDFAKIKE